MDRLIVPAALDGDWMEPFVVRLDEAENVTLSPDVRHAYAPKIDGGGERYATAFGTLTIEAEASECFVGDVVLVEPRQRRIHRWLRAGDTNNTLLITEQCDQLCIMCSQPPRKTHLDQFAEIGQACRLADYGVEIGLSGGEPTLHKKPLFDLLLQMQSERPDLSFHVLTNAQHIDRDDIPTLHALRDQVVWGVPIYAADARLHDEIVGKPGAFERLEESLAILLSAGARLEIRTVIMQQTILELEALSRYVVSRLAGAECWSLMQLEAQGFARSRWADQFFDHSTDFSSLARAIIHARAHGLDAWLYNVPRCTIPAAFRQYAPQSISDWKRAFRPKCETCADQSLCTGMFSWHGGEIPYRNWGEL